MNNDEVEKNIIAAIEILGKVVTENFKIVNERITELFEKMEIFDNLPIVKKEKPVEKTATNTNGNLTAGPGIIKETPKPERPESETPVEEGHYYVDAIFERESEKAEMYSHPDDPKLITWVPKSVIKTYDNKLCKLTLISKYALDKYINWVVKTG